MESKLSLDSEDSEINFDRAFSTTVNSRLGQFAIFQVTIDGEDVFADGPFVY